MASRRIQNNIRKATRAFADKYPGRYELYQRMLSALASSIKKTGNSDMIVGYNKRKQEIKTYVPDN